MQTCGACTCVHVCREGMCMCVGEKQKQCACKCMIYTDRLALVPGLSRFDLPFAFTIIRGIGRSVYYCEHKRKARKQGY